MNTMWLDVGTILRWNRPAVGMVRVELECADYVLSMEKEGRFCRFDPEKKTYFEVSLETVQNAIKFIRGKAQAAQATEPEQEDEQSLDAFTSSSPILSRENMIKERVVQFVEFLPERARKFAWNFLHSKREAFRAVMQACHEIKRAFSALMPKKREDEECRQFLSINSEFVRNEKSDGAIIFSEGDVYISFGPDWDDKDFFYLYDLKKKINFRVVSFCYDIIPVKFPHLCLESTAIQFARYFTDVAWCADEILCISECSRKDLRALLMELGTPLPAMTKIKLGCEIPEVDGDEIISLAVRDLLGKRYIVFVSTLERRKNHELLYRAYVRLIEKGENDLPILVFVGMPGWGVNDFLEDIRLDPRTRQYIRVLTYIEDADLMRLYKNAYFTVYPSLYEGWGLPVAESLAAGKFCLASATSSIPEVGSDLIEYLDPWDVPKWADRLKYYFDSPEKIAELSCRIKKEYKPYSWKETAKQVISRVKNLQDCSVEQSLDFGVSAHKILI